MSDNHPMPPKPKPDLALKIAVGPRRDGAVQIAVGTDDEGPIREVIELVGGVLVLKEHAIYLLTVSDQDDAKGNPAPHTLQKVLSNGYGSPIVRRVIATARFLFVKGLMHRRFSQVALVSAALACLVEILAAIEIHQSFAVDQEAELERAEKRNSGGGAVWLPSVLDVAGRVKMFVHRCDAAVKSLRGMTDVFFANPRGQAWYAMIEEAAAKSGRSADTDSDYLKRMVTYARFVRECRNCAEHPKPGREVRTSNFKRGAGTVIEIPRMEVVHPDTPEPECAITDFMGLMIASILEATEGLMALLARLHIEPGWEEAADVVPLPEDQRRDPEVKYYFVLNLNGRLTPVG